MQAVVLASEAVTAFRRFFPSRMVLLAGAFCCLGLAVFMIQSQRLRWANLLDWRAMVFGAVLPALGVVVVLFGSAQLSTLVRYVLAACTVLLLVVVSVQIVISLVRSV
jgi:hypothetical protein